MTSFVSDALILAFSVRNKAGSVVCRLFLHNMSQKNYVFYKNFEQNACK